MSLWFALALGGCTESSLTPYDTAVWHDEDTDTTALPDPEDTGDPDTDTQSCQPKTCAELGKDCGVVDDGCGGSLTCGTCGAWYSCGDDNVCEAASCIPYEEDTTDGGGTCSGLNQAYTGRGINAGYYAFRVRKPTPQYSGDYDGPPDEVFVQGGSKKGVMLQIIPEGSYVGLSSAAPFYDPEAGCYPGDGCGDEDKEACQSSTPPLRPGIGGFYWGYAYQGASHMQGWIYMDPDALEYVGGDPSHPCALGPAGEDYEVAEACGVPTVCDGDNPTCGEVNLCDEGSDDCGAESCGAESGGPLTPSAHRKSVKFPGEAYECIDRDPPHESVMCLSNGAEEDFFFVYPFGAYLYWAPNSTTKHWLHYGDDVQVYYHARDAQGVLWNFVEVLSSGAPVLTPPSDGAGAPSDCTNDDPENCTPCKNGGTCGWVQEVFLD